jgi:hypothetical protein
MDLKNFTENLLNQEPIVKNKSIFLPLLTIVFLSGYSLRAEVKKPFDRESIDKHKQIYNMSCIPSGVEMILKLTGRAPAQYYELQNEWKNKADGNFGNFDGKTINGLTFHKQFGEPRNDEFPVKELFAVIHKELKAGRYVEISLQSGGGWHIYIVYDEIKHGEFIAVSKDGEKTIKEEHVKRIVREMKGTDILTYRMYQGDANKD